MICRIAVLTTLLYALSFGAENGNFRLNNGETSITTVSADINSTVISLRISEIEYEKTSLDGAQAYRVSLPDQFGLCRGAYMSEGDILVPTITRMIAVPFDSSPEIEVAGSKFVELNEITLAPADQEDVDSYGGGDQSAIRNLQNNIVVGQVAGEMRDIRIYSVTFSPVQYNPRSKTLRVYDEIDIEIKHGGSRLIKYEGQVSEAFMPIYRSILDNPTVFDPVQVTRGAYWVIYADPFYEHIQPIVEWKRLKGFHVEYIPKSDIGSNPSYTTIKTYISARFDTCQVKPDYITILGDVTMPGGYGIPTRTYNNPFGMGDIESDNYYTFLQGGDYFPEVLIGRISIDYVSDLENYTNKFFTYERTPYMEDTGWYLKGLVVSGGDDGYFVSPRMTKLLCRDNMLNAGYTHVDTLFESWWDPVYTYEIDNSINGGVSFVNYRGYGAPSGWASPYYLVGDIYYLTNGPRYPVMTSIVCGTGDYNDYVDVCFGEAWIRYPNKGGAGFMGTSNHDTHTRYNNAIDAGVYWAYFVEGVSTITQAQLMGKMTLYYAFPSETNPNGRVESYFNSYNVLGDPELNCWTGIPRTMTVACDDSVEFGQNYLSVEVTGILGLPLEGAYVCLWKDGELFMGDFVPADGVAEFQAEPATSGDMALTVTARNYAPYEGTVTYIDSDVTVGYDSRIIDDDDQGESSGNGDGICSPSEIIELNITLQNYGQSETAYGVTARVSSDGPYATILRDNAEFGDIAPGENGTSDMPYLIEMTSDAPDGTILNLILSISDRDGNSWESITRVPVEAAELAVEDLTIEDGNNGMIDPGEVVELVITVGNTGAQSLTGASATLRTSDDQVTIVDSTAFFGDCAPGESFDNEGDTFMLTVESEIYVGHIINFTLEFEGDGPQTLFAAFSENVGVVTDSDPIGPDNYGYYCFDNTDESYPYHPEYDWVPINTSEWDYVTLDDDEVETIALPFEVQYYGEIFTTLTICDNGFVALGDTWWNNWLNTSIPAPQNAPGMVAPFWDDFKQYNLRIYYHHDTDNNRFIVGWNNAWDDDVSRNQTFEIIFLDASAWPTLTGDNEIIFQYYQIQNVYSMSAGICSPDKSDGIGYVFSNSYADGAASVVNGRAIKFTTGSEYQTEVDDDIVSPTGFALSQNYPNPFNSSTSVEFELPEEGQVLLEVFNVLGQRVITLADGRFDAGIHRINWDAEDMRSGIYFYKLAVNGLTDTRRMTLLK